jgi:hypothetical protein
MNRLFRYHLRKVKHDLAFYTARGWRPPSDLITRLDNLLEERQHVL